MSKAYDYSYKGVKIDPYRIFTVYDITDPAIQHAIKKLLRLGRGFHKDIEKDVAEAIQSLKRWQEMRSEDQLSILEAFKEIAKAVGEEPPKAYLGGSSLPQTLHPLMPRPKELTPETASPLMALEGTLPPQMVPCGICGTMVLPGRLLAHMKDRHQGSPGASMAWQQSQAPGPERPPKPPTPREVG